MAALPAGMFAPFTVHEWVTEPEEEFDACLDWPAPAHPDPPITTPPPYAPRNLPVLVLSGDLDSLTTPAEGRQTTRDMGPSGSLDPDPQRHARQRHGRPGRLRLRAGADLHQGSGRSAADERLLRPADTGGPGRRHLPRDAPRVTPATAGPGDQAGRTGLRLAAVGAAAVGDAVWRWYYGDGVKGWGLRGGTFRFTGNGSRIGIRLTRVRWTSDTRVSGTVRWNQVSGQIRARLTIAGPGGISASLGLWYLDYVRHSVAHLSGHYRGHRIIATMPAP